MTFFKTKSIARGSLELVERVILLVILTSIKPFIVTKTLSQLSLLYILLYFAILTTYSINMVTVPDIILLFIFNCVLHVLLHFLFTSIYKVSVSNLFSISVYINITINFIMR